MRKSGSVTDKVCNYINSKPIGHQFTNKDVREEMDIPYNLLERECYVLIGLKVCGCVKRVKRGLWEVTARVPDFVDSTIFDGNHGYTKYEGTYPNGTWVPRGKKWKVGEPNPYTGEPTVTETTTTNKTGKRKAGSLFDQICTFINSKEIGTEFHNDELFGATVETTSFWKEKVADKRYITRWYRYMLMHANVVQKLGKCKWKVLAHIPEDVDSNRVNGWKHGWNNIWKSTVTVEIPVTEYNVTNVIERVDSMMEVIDESNNATEDVECKFIYALNINNEHIRKIKVRKAVHARSNEYYSLHAAIAALANLTAGTIEQVADLMLEELEEDKLSVPATEHSIEVLNETKEEVVGEHVDTEEDKLIKELDEVLAIIDISDEDPVTQFVYGYKDGRFYKKKTGHIYRFVEECFEGKTLKNLVAAVAFTNRDAWTLTAKEEIEKIKIETESNNIKQSTQIMLEDLTKKINLEIIVNPHHITIEDIRGKEAYLYEDGLIGKGIIKSFQLRCGDDKTPEYHDIEIEVKWSDGVQKTKRIDDAKLLITKEEAFKKLEDNLNSL